MDTVARSLIEDMDDQSFCETLIPIMQNGKGSGLALLYEDWVLARLRVIRHRDGPYFYHTFLTVLSATFPHQVRIDVLLTAMNTVTTQVDVEAGDVLPEVWAAEIEEVFRHGLPQGLHPGWAALRPHYRPIRGDVTVITGLPSHFKSAFMHALAINLARNHGWNFAAFNPEHHPLGSLGSWLEESYAGRRLHELDPDEHRFAREWVTDHFHMIRPTGEVPATLAWLLAVGRIQKQRYGVDGLILDPWNYIDHSFDLREMKETDYIGKSLSTVKRFAEYQEMHVWIVAHPTKPEDGKAKTGDYKGKYAPATPYNINGGANWFNKADMCLSCWRDAEEDSDILEVHIQKNRRREQCGWPGMAQLRFDGRRFHDLGDMTTPHWTDHD